MKKSIFYVLMLAAIAMSCESKSGTTTTAGADSTISDSVPNAPTAAVAQESDIEGTSGYYVGDFSATKYHEGKDPSYSNRINVSIDHLGGGKVSGHSVVAGNSRPFTGTYTMEGESYKVVAAEPGDDKYDGKFSFVLDAVKHSIVGTWVANDPKVAVYEREYDLVRREFKYDADLDLPESVEYSFLYSKNKEFEDLGKGEFATNAVLKFNASNTKLKKEDIENMYKGDLEILRNSIYARHGYSFKTRKMRYVFDSSIDWYIPVSTDVSKELTQIEQDNIALIKRYEKHAETYYDDFGR